MTLAATDSSVGRQRISGASVMAGRHLSLRVSAVTVKYAAPALSTLVLIFFNKPVAGLVPRPRAWRSAAAGWPVHAGGGAQLEGLLVDLEGEVCDATTGLIGE